MHSVTSCSLQNTPIHTRRNKYNLRIKAPCAILLVNTIDGFGQFEFNLDRLLQVPEQKLRKTKETKDRKQNNSK